MLKGILVVNKLPDWTSFDVVNYVKHALKTSKVGHLGTLDPMATGLLLITIGSATKVFDVFLNKSKTYIADFEFGYTTDSLDKTGTITKTTTILPTKDEIEKEISSFLGEIEQIPPIYSAKSINGKRAYEYARNGENIELKPAKVHIYDMQLVDYKKTDNKLVVSLKIKCSAGTYIRAIGRDLAEKLNSLACMTSLVRTNIEMFDLQNAINVKGMDSVSIKEHIQPLDIVFQNYDVFDADEQDKLKILNGVKLPTVYQEGVYRLYLKDEFFALVKVENGMAKMFKFFN